MYKCDFKSVEVFVGEREAHVAPMYNPFFGDHLETQQGKKMKMWLKGLLLP